MGLPLKSARLAFATLLLATVFAETAFAELTARLSSPRIDETQTLELIIRTESRDVQGMPDLSPIEPDFEVLTTRTSSQYRVINGNVQAWTEWIIALRPLRTGTLNIPALTYRNESTEPLSLLVVPLDPAVKKQMGDRVFFETSTTPESPYVQAQTIYTRRLLYADGTQIYGEMPDTPAIENAVVLVLGNATSSTVTRDGKRYGMIEQRYAIFPERSGTLEIPGAMVSGSVRMKVNNRLRRNGVRVIAEPTIVEVRPIPASYPKDTPWLPASEVTLLEAWDSSPPTFKLGESLTQTLIVRSDSATGSIIPPVDYSIPDSHFRSYPEQPDIADNRGASGVIGTRSQSFSMIPTAQGKISLPEVSLTWFNTNTNSVETSSLPGRDIRIFGPVESGPNERPKEAPEATPAIGSQSDTPLTVDVSQRRVFHPVWIALLVALCGIGLWLLRERLPVWAPARQLAQPRFMRLRRSKQRLLDTIASGSAEQIRDVLTLTTREFSAAGKPLNPHALTALQEQLNRATYARVVQEPDREGLRALADGLFEQNAVMASRSSLPELYG